MVVRGCGQNSNPKIQKGKSVNPTISVNSVGPVVEFEYELTEPGVHVITGDHGAGKSTILRTVELATGGRVDMKPTKMDGAKSGTAVVAGKTIRIAKTTREEGELSLEGLSDLDLAGLHTPRFLDAATRDKHRIRALVRLANVAPDPALFHELLGGKEAFDATVDADAIQTDDMVEMAAKVKRCIEKAAQATEKQAETARARMAAQVEQCSGVPMDAPHDAKELQAILVAAIEAKTRISQQRADALETIQQAAEARANLLEIGPGPISPADATDALDRAKGAHAAALDTVESLEKQLERARHAAELAEAKVTAAEAAMEASRQYEATVAGWNSQIAAASKVECPTKEQMAEAVAAVDAANAAAELGAKVRAAIAARAEADRYASVAKEHEASAVRFRKAAAATQDVLSEALSAIPDCALKVWNDADGNARLVIETDRSEREPFDELSDGERYDVLIPMLARSGRIIVLSQAAFGELSPTIRGRVHELARQRGCFVLTAQADSGELRASLYQPELAEVVA
jgi:hypothetical protein